MLALDPTEGCAYARRVGDVEGQRARGVGQPGGLLRQPRLIPPVQDHPRPRRGQPLRDGQPEAARAAGYQGEAIGKIELRQHVTPSLFDLRT